MTNTILTEYGVWYWFPTQRLYGMAARPRDISTAAKYSPCRLSPRSSRGRPASISRSRRGVFWGCGSKSPGAVERGSRKSALISLFAPQRVIIFFSGWRTSICGSAALAGFVFGDFNVISHIFWGHDSGLGSSQMSKYIHAGFWMLRYVRI